MIHLLINGIVISIFVLWFLVCAVAQLYPMIIKQRNPFGLIANWNFFAPVPASDNHLLFYRYKFDNQSLSHWMQLNPDFNRTFINAFWNPQYYPSKICFDVCMELINALKLSKTNNQDWRLSISNQILQNHLKTLNKPAHAGQVQFMVLARCTRTQRLTSWVRSDFIAIH